MSEHVTVKVVQVPGKTEEVVLESGATVSDALSTAGINDTSGYSVKLNAENTSMDSTVSDGDRIIVAKSAKGNG